MLNDEIYQNCEREVPKPIKDNQDLKLSPQIATSRWDSTKSMLTVMCVVLLCGIIVLGVVSAIKDKNSQQTTCPKAQVNITGVPRCESGWILHGHKCYLFSIQKLNWTESHQKCISAGGNLVSIDKEEEQLFLVKFIVNLKETPFWIGLTDMEKEGHWLWPDGKPLQDNLTFWYEGQPDNQHDEYPVGQDCVWIKNVQHAHNWMDGYCSRLHGRICAVSAVE